MQQYKTWYARSMHISFYIINNDRRHPRILSSGDFEGTLTKLAHIYRKDILWVAFTNTLDAATYYPRSSAVNCLVYLWRNLLYLSTKLLLYPIPVNKVFESLLERYQIKEQNIEGERNNEKLTN